MLGENSVKGIPPRISRTREAVADFRELIDVHLGSVVLNVLQGEGPEVPEARYV